MNKEIDKLRALNNTLQCCVEVIRAIQFDSKSSYEEKLRGLITLEKTLPELKRILIWLINMKRGH